MILGDEDGRSDLPPRPDQDLPWILDADRLANWSDTALYEMEKSFREWLFKAMKSSVWKVPSGKGKWNIGSRMTFDLVRNQFNIEATDYKNRSMLSKLCRHYATRVKVTVGGIKIKGKRHSDYGFYFPRTPVSVKKPYSLRLRFELLMEEGDRVVSLKEMRLSKEKTAIEMNETRKLQNAKTREYQKRWQKKYGDKYDYSGTNRLSDEDTNSRS